MKNFILKTFLFLVPVLIVFGVADFFYATDKGDLLRIGYVADVSYYNRQAIFGEEFKQKLYYTRISEIELHKTHKFKLLSIGDSFSQQQNFGYPNYLAESMKDSILHYDGRLIENQYPIEILMGLINGDVLDSIKVDFIILETVERNFVKSAPNVNRTGNLSLDSLETLIQRKKGKVKMKKTDRLFSGSLKNFYVTNYNYLLDDNAFDSKTYKVPLSEKLFSTNSTQLLFYYNDLNSLNSNNDLEKVKQLHSELNFLSQQLTKKGITLIVIPAPDKYDFYYEYIVDKSKYPEPLFFEHFKHMENRDYVYIDAKNILNNYITEKKDLYFYDDTHWSPFASKIVAKEIEKVIAEH